MLYILNPLGVTSIDISNGLAVYSTGHLDEPCVWNATNIVFQTEAVRFAVNCIIDVRPFIGKISEIIINNWDNEHIFLDLDALMGKIGYTEKGEVIEYAIQGVDISYPPKIINYMPQGDG